MSVRITDNTQKVIIDTRAKAVAFLRVAADEYIKIATPKTPKNDNDLRTRILKQVQGLNAKVTWNMPYAGAQEAGQMTVKSDRKVKLKNGDWITLKAGVHKFSRYTTPGTGAHFAENAAKQLPFRSMEIARKSGII